ncbi:MAG: gliding motility-associated C-terminal domain-containing protein [Bacteroidota bacterium]
MTLPRYLTIACFCFILISGVSGQDSPGLAGSQQLNTEELFLLDSLSADSTAGELAIPNVFTPNGDQNNDFIEVETDGTTVYRFTIYTRTGMRVFQSTSPRIFWDGRNNNGNALKQGVYYYVIEESGRSDSPGQKAGFIYLYK